jgi:SAM-dependent methyltransferase
LLDKTVSDQRVERIVCGLLPLIADRNIRTMLDLGCGDGRVGRRLASQLGATLQAYDVQKSPINPGPVTLFDGVHVDAGPFDLCLLSDVLHHAPEPEPLLREALRVADVVLLKDHMSFSNRSEQTLLAMDLIGNLPLGVAVTGNYLSPAAWDRLFAEVSSRPAKLVWPLDVHSPALRLLTRSEHQFAARLDRAPTGAR